MFIDLLATIDQTRVASKSVLVHYTNFSGKKHRSHDFAIVTNYFSFTWASGTRIYQFRKLFVSLSLSLSLRFYTLQKYVRNV